MTSLWVLARYWRELSIGLLVLALSAVLLIDGRKLAQCKQRTAEAIAALDKTKADYRAAQATAAAENQAQVRQVEQANATRTQEIQHDLSTQLADARAAGAAYAARLRAQGAAAGRPAGATGAPGQADPASGVAGAGEAALLDADIVACSENTVKAEGWQTFWNGLTW